MYVWLYKEEQHDAEMGVTLP